MKNKILVVEDDRAISELLCMNLNAAGYETAAAYDGEEARRLLLWHEDADLVLLDIMLPGKDGFSIIEDFKSRNLPVICLTAKDDVASKVRGLRLGAEDYMVKPFEMLELLVRIEKVLERTGRAKRFLGIRGRSGGSQKASGDEGRDGGESEAHGVRSFGAAAPKPQYCSGQRGNTAPGVGNRVFGRKQDSGRSHRTASEKAGTV